MNAPAFDTEVKLTVFRTFARFGRRPSVDEVAERMETAVGPVLAAYGRLAAQRLLVLEPDRGSIRMAPPFSGVPTQHVVESGGVRYFANCAWDALGVLAALGRAGVVRSRCAGSGEPLYLPVGVGGPEPSGWLFHSLLPAARWWDDIVFTCANMLFFRSEEDVAAWCAARGAEPGPVATMDQLWGMATTWYGTRLQAHSRRPQPDEIRGIFAGLGLREPFWDPQADRFG